MPKDGPVHKGRNMRVPTDKSKVIVHNDGTVTFFRKIQGFPNGGVWQRSPEAVFRQLETCAWTELKRAVHHGRVQGADSSLDRTAHASKGKLSKDMVKSRRVKALNTLLTGNAEVDLRLRDPHEYRMRMLDSIRRSANR